MFGVTTWDPSSYAFGEMTHATNAEAWKWKMQLGEREKGDWCHRCHHLLQFMMFHDGSCSYHCVKDHLLWMNLCMFANCLCEVFFIIETLVIFDSWWRDAMFFDPQWPIHLRQVRGLQNNLNKSPIPRPTCQLFFVASYFICFFQV